MNRKERFVIAAVLFLIAVMVGVDLVTDTAEGVVLWHVLVEGFIALLALFGVFFILRGTVELKHELDKKVSELTDYKEEAEQLKLQWKLESRKYLDGLSNAIDQQLIKWNLTKSEKEVAFLLLKGMSIKEIATIRDTAEKTARAQSIAIYSKSGLSGRSELSAFFLEDLLVPPENETIK